MTLNARISKIEVLPPYLAMDFLAMAGQGDG